MVVERGAQRRALPGPRLSAGSRSAPRSRPAANFAVLALAWRRRHGGLGGAGTLRQLAQVLARRGRPRRSPRWASERGLARLLPLRPTLAGQLAPRARPDRARARSSTWPLPGRSASGAGRAPGRAPPAPLALDPSARSPLRAPVARTAPARGFGAATRAAYLGSRGLRGGTHGRERATEAEWAEARDKAREVAHDVQERLEGMRGLRRRRRRVGPDARARASDDGDRGRGRDRVRVRAAPVPRVAETGRAQGEAGWRRWARWAT